MDHPFGERFADAAALQEAGHHPASQPVVRQPAHRADQGVAVGREGEGAVHPVLDAHFLQHGIAGERHLQLPRDPVGILLDQVETVVPGRAVDIPVPVVDLVDADQHAVLVLAQIGEAFQIDRHWHFEIERFELRDRFGYQIVVRQRRNRQFQADHPADLLGPQAAGIDDMLGEDRALFGDDLPGAVRPLFQVQHPIVLDHGGPALARRAGIGVDGPGGVDIALPVGPQAADHTVDIHDRAAFPDLRRRHQVAILDADGLEDPIGALQPFPARRGGGDRDAAGHVQADIVAGFRSDLAQQVDGIGLERGHVRIGVERMDAAGGVPGRSGGQHRALDQRDVGPAELRQMIEHRGADHAAPDHHDPVLVHRTPPCRPRPRTFARCRAD